ncbi:MAG: hypothetical protein FJ279_14365 [Planctomycetes bacterium]|nr:hypothetical protein [Planctomycetota bacterium]
MLGYIPLSRSAGIPRLGVTVLLRVDFLVMGLCYLLNLDVMLGLWAFHLMALLEQGLFNLFAVDAGRPRRPHSAGGLLLANQQSGALIFFVGASLWIARRYLYAAVRDAWRGEWNGVGLLSPRAAVVTGLLGLAYPPYGGRASGLPLGWAAGFLFVALCFFFGTTRLLVQIRHTADWGGCARRLRPRPFRRTARFLMGTAAHALSPPRRSAAHGCRQAAWCCWPWVRRTADARRGTRRVRLGGFCSYPPRRTGSGMSGDWFTDMAGTS